MRPHGLHAFIHSDAPRLALAQANDLNPPHGARAGAPVFRRAPAPDPAIHPPSAGTRPEPTDSRGLSTCC